MIVKDVMRENTSDIEVKVCGVNPTNDCDPYTEEYYHGKLGEIPEDLQLHKVLQTSWSLGSECHVIQIPYITQAMFTAKECDEAIRGAAALSNAIVRIVETIHDAELMNKLDDTQDRIFELMKMIEKYSHSEN